MSRRRGSDSPIGNSPPGEQTWRDLLANAFDSFTARAPSRSPSRSPSPSPAPPPPPVTTAGPSRRHAASMFTRTMPAPASSTSNRSTPRHKHHARGPTLRTGINGDHVEMSVASPLASAVEHTDWFVAERPPQAATCSTAADEPAPSPGPAQEAGEALENERAARRAQMAVVATAARDFVPHQLAPAPSHRTTLDQTQPPSSTSASDPTPPSARALADACASLETESYFASECEACSKVAASLAAGDDPLLIEPCPWRTALGPGGNWRSRATAAAWSMAGIPSAHRAEVWLACLGLDTEVARASWTTYYTALLSAVASVAEAESDAASSSPGSRRDPTVGGAHPRAHFSTLAFGEVLKDVERTLPGMPLFATPPQPPTTSSSSEDVPTSGVGHRALQRLLLAFSLHRPLVSYCQSLNFIAAGVLLVCGGRDEALAFGVLCHLLEPRLAYYTRSMLGCVADARALRDLLAFGDADLAGTLSKHGVALEHFASGWLLCAFFGSPLPPQHAVRVWDLQMLLGEHVMLLAGVALVAVHRQHFFSVPRPTPEALMAILTRRVGVATDVNQLLAAMRCRLDDDGEACFVAHVASLRRLHKHDLVRENATLPPSRSRRLTRTTNLDARELQRLWTCMLDASDDPWATLVAGAIVDVTHFRIALAAAAFKGTQPSTHAAGGVGRNDVTSPAGRHHQHTRSFETHHHSSGPGGALVSESDRWKGGGVACAVALRARGRCVTGCVPPLPASTHLSRGSRVLVSCPRCSWALGRAEPPPTAPSAWIAVGSVCTCECDCAARGVTAGHASSSSGSRSVFQRLFHYFDGGDSGSAGAGAGGGAKGFLDFDAFARAARLFLHSERVERLHVVFRLAGGREDKSSSTSDVVPPPTMMMTTGGGVRPTDDGIQRGRVCRADFEALVASFEELYHGRTNIHIPHQAPSASPPPYSHARLRRSMTADYDDEESDLRLRSPSSSASSITSPSSSSSTSGGGSGGGSGFGAFSPPSSPNGGAGVGAGARVQLASSMAAARMFVDMAFEKEAASSSTALPSVVAVSLDPNESSIELVPSSLLTADAAPTDSLSYESFASFILLHPLIATFFRLDAIADY